MFSSNFFNFEDKPEFNVYHQEINFYPEKKAKSKRGRITGNLDIDLKSSDFMARSVSENNPIFVKNRASLRIFEKVEEQDEVLQNPPHEVGKNKVMIQKEPEHQLDKKLESDNNSQVRGSVKKVHNSVRNLVFYEKDTPVIDEESNGISKVKAGEVHLQMTTEPMNLSYPHKTEKPLEYGSSHQQIPETGITAVTEPQFQPMSSFRVPTTQHNLLTVQTGKYPSTKTKIDQETELLDPLKESSDELVNRILAGNFGRNKNISTSERTSRTLQSLPLEGNASPLGRGSIQSSGVGNIPLSSNLKDLYLSNAETLLNQNGNGKSRSAKLSGIDVIGKVKIFSERQQLYEKYSENPPVLEAPVIETEQEKEIKSKIQNLVNHIDPKKVNRGALDRLTMQISQTAAFRKTPPIAESSLMNNIYEQIPDPTEVDNFGSEEDGLHLEAPTPEHKTIAFPSVQKDLVNSEVLVSGVTFNPKKARKARLASFSDEKPVDVDEELRHSLTRSQTRREHSNYASPQVNKYVGIDDADNLEDSENRLSGGPRKRRKERLASFSDEKPVDIDEELRNSLTRVERKERLASFSDEKPVKTIQKKQVSKFSSFGSSNEQNDFHIRVLNPVEDTQPTVIEQNQEKGGTSDEIDSHSEEQVDFEQDHLKINETATFKAVEPQYNYKNAHIIPEQSELYQDSSDPNIIYNRIVETLEKRKEDRAELLHNIEAPPVQIYQPSTRKQPLRFYNSSPKQDTVQIRSNTTNAIHSLLQNNMRESTSPIKKASELYDTPDPIGKWLNYGSVKKRIERPTYPEVRTSQRSGHSSGNISYSSLNRASRLLMGQKGSKMSSQANSIHSKPRVILRG